MRPLLPLLALCTAGLAQAATPTHLYLMDDTSDALGGSTLTTLGGDFTSKTGHYSFGPNQGFWLADTVNADVYTLDFAFSLDTVSGYRRLVDFKALTSDTGLYNLNTRLNFYNAITGADAVFAAGQDGRVTLTRDAAGLVTGYFNGVQQFQFNDASGLARFSSANRAAYFFRDDNAVSGEASGGTIDYLRVYGVALTSAEVAGLTSPVPEPSTGLLAAAGIGLFALLRRRQR